MFMIGFWYASIVRHISPSNKSQKKVRGTS